MKERFESDNDMFYLEQQRSNSAPPDPLQFPEEPRNQWNSASLFEPSRFTSNRTPVDNFPGKEK